MDEIELRIKAEFKRRLYLPLMKILQEPASTLSNALGDEQALWEALQTGKITFNRGVFSGKFDARTTRALKKFSAKWSKMESAFKIPLNDMPIPIQQIIQATQNRFQRKIDAIDAQLSQVVPSQLAANIRLGDLLDKTIFKVDTDFRENVKNISIQPKLTKWQKDKISKEWENNLKLTIQDFAKSEIKELRKSIEKSYMAGNRYGSLVGQIQTSYGVSATKAKFLARQETKLLTVKYAESRYVDAGCPKYTWRCVAGSPMHPVRPAHKKLDGTVQEWAHPPITTEPGELVRRNNAGSDWNCRCLPSPIAEFRGDRG